MSGGTGKRPPPRFLITLANFPPYDKTSLKGVNAVCLLGNGHPIDPVMQSSCNGKHLLVIYDLSAWHTCPKIQHTLLKTAIANSFHMIAAFNVQHFGSWHQVSQSLGITRNHIIAANGD